MPTGGQRDDCPQFENVMDRIRVARRGPGRPRTRPDHVVADKGCNSRTVRARLRRRGIKHTVPERIGQLNGRIRRGERPCGFDPATYRRRNVVERCFNRLKHFRGIAIRYDKTATSYQAAVTLAATLLWLRPI